MVKHAPLHEIEDPILQSSRFNLVEIVNSLPEKSIIFPIPCIIPLNIFN